MSTFENAGSQEVIGYLCLRHTKKKCRTVWNCVHLWVYVHLFYLFLLVFFFSLQIHSNHTQQRSLTSLFVLLQGRPCVWDPRPKTDQGKAQQEGQCGHSVPTSCLDIRRRGGSEVVVERWRESGWWQMEVGGVRLRCWDLRRYLWRTVKGERKRKRKAERERVG